MRNGLQTSDEGPAQEGRGRFSIRGFGIKLMLLFSKIPLTRCAEQENNSWSLSSHLSQPDSGSSGVWFGLFPSGGLDQVLQAEELWEFVLVVVHKSLSVFYKQWGCWLGPMGIPC